MAEYWKNGQKYIIPDTTEEELAEMEAEQQKAERKYWQTVDYGEAVNALFRQRYSQHAAEAIINNFLSDPTNEKYAREMQEMQDYRAWCKEYVKEKFAQYGRKI